MSLLKLNKTPEKYALTKRDKEEKGEKEKVLTACERIKKAS